MVITLIMDTTGTDIIHTAHIEVDTAITTAIKPIHPLDVGAQPSAR